MKLRIEKKIYLLAIITIVMSCKKPYDPPQITPVTGFLVVEGFINAGNDSTKFMLSRTVSLTSSTVDPVTNAQVTVEGINSSKYPLTSNGAGLYSSPALNLDPAQKYRLHIITDKGDEYTSDYVSVKITPPIDSVSYIIKNNGLQINLDTHDPANQTHYYRWDFVETWKFHSQYDSFFVSNGDTVLPRRADQDVYYCYAGANSNSVLIGSSAKLTQDVIATAPITFVPSTSQKLQTQYSILVNQYALTSDAYNFWQLLKNNTEDLGSIFDVQPSEISGNIHSVTNPNEHVIGYISASTVQSKRIFVAEPQLPSTWRPTYSFSCELDSFLFVKNYHNEITHPEDIAFNANKGGGGQIPVTAIVSGQIVLGHLGTFPNCADCTFQGTLKKPSFWP